MVSGAFAATNLPPDFTEKLANVEAAPGEEIQFKVKTAGIPKPQVKWYREVMNQLQKHTFLKVI